MTRHLPEARTLVWERASRYREEIQLIRDSFGLSLLDWINVDSDTQLELIKLASLELHNAKTSA